MKLLQKLSDIAGVPGFEHDVRALCLEAVKEHADHTAVDRLGNVIARKEGTGPKVAVAAHMDEIGFMVSHVDAEKGFLRMDPLGGFDPRTLLASRVTVHTRGGPLPGIIGSKPIHILKDEEKKQPLTIPDLFVDLGLPGKEVAERVRMGDPITLRQEFINLGRLVSGKALDDRVGLYVGLEAFRRMKDPKADVHFIGTVQEEVGLRGARTSAFSVAPDIAVALDVTIACDVPGAQPHEEVTALGKGVAIKLKDSASISHPGLVRFMIDLAEERDIPYQMEILPRGGTDAGAMQMTGEGAAVVTLSVPTRYVHSVVEAVHLDDVEATIALLTAFLERCHEVDLRL